MTNDLLDSLIARDLPAAQRGDVQAYGRLVSATQRMVASVALSVTRDVHTSEDIAQETFLTAWLRMGQLGSSQSLLPWLRQVARNRAIDHVRAQRYRETPIDPLDTLAMLAVAPQPGPAEKVVSDEEARQLSEALDEIPEASRDVLLLYYREGENTRDVAALLGITETAVRKRLQRGRDSLRAEWLKQFADTARSSAPGIAFTASISTAVALTPATAVAAGVSAAKAGGFSLKWLLGGACALMGAVGLVVGAVVLAMRIHVRKASTPAARRALIHNGIAYAALMGSYIVLLAWARNEGWPNTQILMAGVVFSVGIFLLAWERRKHQRRDGDSSCG